MKLILRCFVSLIVTLVAAAVIRSADDVSDKTPAEQFASLTKEYEDQLSEFNKKLWAIHAEQERAGFYINYPAPTKVNARLISLSEKSPDDPIAFEALAWVIVHPGIARNDLAAIRKPFDVLLRDHLSSDKLPRVFDSAEEDFLRAVLEKSPHRQVRGLACFAIAEQQLNRIRYVRRFRDENPAWLLSKQWLRLVPADSFFVTMNIDEATKAAEAMLEQVVRDYDDVPIADRRNGKTIGELAKNHLHELHDLGIGKVMPELKSVALDGNPVRLSDLKGKVVVLDVWATWCGPCCAMIPDERNLENTFAGKPFALVSISVDDYPKTVSEFLVKEHMPWTHWYNGPNGPIIADLNAYFYPTNYVLDSKGVIRYKDIRGELLAQAVDVLLKEMENPK